MTTKSKLMMLTVAAVLSGTAGFAQVDDTTTPPPVTQPEFDFAALLALFTGPDTPDADAIAGALPEGFTVQRLRVRGDGSVRVDATTDTGERVRVIVRDGEVRYRVKDSSDTSDANSDDTSDSNGDNSDDSSDSNSDDSSDDNSDSSGGGSSGDSSDD